MRIDPKSNTAIDNYKLLTNLVVPRPIAWVTSQNDAGVVNLAPFSFFNAVGSNPLYLLISVGRNDDGSTKDTANNISASGEFVVNMVTEDVLAAMNVSAADFPADESELLAAGLHMAASEKIAVPRVAESQASMECKLHSAQALGAYTIFVGEVVMFHVADHLLGERMHVNGFAPIGRLGSPSYYCRTTDRFNLPRLAYATWRDGAG
ncbi:MAG: flavin reductase family protein [Burkholderiales bacterium]|nr:flavin reductase family protein [Burkholderiales bacterium]